VTSEAAALGALLVAGHALGDFVFQTGWMVRHKSRPSGLLAHGAVVATCHAAMLVPFAGLAAGLAVLGVAAAHVLVDAGKTALSARAPRLDLEWFLADQAVHVGVIAAAWAWLAPRAALFDPSIADPGTLRATGVLVAAYAFNVNGASSLVVAVLERCRIAARDAGPSAGRVVGILERMLALTLLLQDKWEALGLLVAAKSLARFRDLDERARAEYYLVGTLLSLLGATVTVLIVRAVLAG
jgi:hypothetical protein